MSSCAVPFVFLFRVHIRLYRPFLPSWHDKCCLLELIHLFVGPLLLSNQFSIGRVCIRHLSSFVSFIRRSTCSPSSFAFDHEERRSRQIAAPRGDVSGLR